MSYEVAITQNYELLITEHFSQLQKASKWPSQHITLDLDVADVRDGTISKWKPSQV